MKLTNAQISHAKPKDKDCKLTDGGGLHLLVRKNGSKLWKHRLRIDGREQKLSYGPYPLVTLKEAREKRDMTKLAMLRGENPVQQRREAKLAAQFREQNSFQDVAKEFISKREQEGLAPSTIKKSRWFLSLLSPAIGRRPIDEVSSMEVLSALKKIEKRGHRESARKTRSFASRVFQYGVITGRCSSDPAHPLRGALVAPVVTHYAAITDPAELGKLLRGIDQFDGFPASRYALKILPHVFVRPGELRLADWAEFNLRKAEWTIPEGRMKARKPHRVPLSKQVCAMLNELGAETDFKGFVFASLHARGRPISENTINQSLRRLGYQGSEMTGHGFRSTASTLLNESGRWSADAIERALAHRDTNAIRGIYHRGEHWAERVEMAQWWSDYLDDLKKERLP
ncbi:tyrosine-type recombinase/integrase [Erythrobacter aurantius]|uniref:tyrosine-type recombinase/integrase n=1 Tax=Erythrobacter aurantius TaxID=2909249 RepID=UPI00207A2335|nr:integrase arm-type DNA-binding domain-containing protein [Erythrobacter aurantius]